MMPNYTYLLCSPFFFINLLLIALYPAARLLLNMQQRSIAISDDFLLGQSRETQIIGLVGMVLTFKSLKCATNDELIALCFLYLKVAALILFYLANPSYAIYYSLLCFIVFFVIRQPIYDGPSKLVKIQSQQQLLEGVIGVKSEKDLVIGLKAYDEQRAKEKLLKKQKKFSQGVQSQKSDFSTVRHTLMVFNARWCQNCVFNYMMWVKFANRFTTSKLRVVEIDTRLHEKTLCKLFKVNARDGNQLPSLILLEDNREVLRFPPIDYEKGSLSKVLTYKEKELIKYFDLEKRFMATNFE
mmetsp:Transcript_4792/g.8217  ORF Transcript_4792/g.8217 Transcript_4792/m.8217 type:complete len:298 (-) Transcript_4792:128-1021(-)